jgi:hypothetical protein
MSQPSIPVITDAKTVFVAWTNSDLTEGRGYRVPLIVAQTYSTALREGRRGSVMGSDCNVSEEIAVRLAGSGTWFVPGIIHYPTQVDIEAEKRRNEALEAVRKAKAAGLTDKDIETLRRQE